MTSQEAAPAQESAPSAASASSGSAPTDAAAPVSADSVSSASREAQAAATRRRIKIGSERHADREAAREASTPRPPADTPREDASAETPEAPVEGAASEAPRGSYPPPRLSSRITEDVEKEIEEALQGQSIGDLMEPASGPAGGLPDELAPKTRLKAKVVKLHRDNVFVDLGNSRDAGVVMLKQFKEPPELGQELDLIVTKHDTEEGLYELAVAGASAAVQDWSHLSEGMVVEAEVTGTNTGGLECMVNKIRGFIPASQVAIYRVEDLTPFVGQRLSCVITEAKPKRRNLVLSHRAILEREKSAEREKALEDLAVGQARDGIVTNIRDFGAFVDIGGVEGMIHVSQLSWNRVNHPKDVLEVGQKVEVKVVKVNKETRKIGLSIRDLARNPWHDVEERYPSKSRVSGKVTKIKDFGAFVEIETGLEGLLHISELDHKRVMRVGDVVALDQEVEAMVLSVDAKARRISLSLKALLPPPARKQGDKGDRQFLAESTDSSNRPKTKRSGDLKGGFDRPTGGKDVGLKW
jgi:small subunit ribosomal protein S1